MTEIPAAAAAKAAPLSANSITIRLATLGDDAWVAYLQELAFGPGRFARAAFRVRERHPIDKSLSLIAEIDGVRVSSVLMTPISVGGIDGYLLGPLATDPAYRNRGAGKALVREVSRLALSRGEGRYVLLIGDPPYYGPLGFVPTVPGAISFPGPVDPRRVLVHSHDADMATRLSGAVAGFGDTKTGDRTECPDETGGSTP